MNNRQNGRRRGRNNQRPQSQGRGNQDQGNRIDNRARGNATQLLEKYRNMARDAQLSGDRVMTEYYLQFADHYFRVLSDTRLRQEEQRARFDDRDGGRDDDRELQQIDGEDEGDDGDELDAIDSIGRAPRNRNGRDFNGNRDGQQRDGQQRDGNRDGNREPGRERLGSDRNGGRDDSRRDEPRREARPERDGNRDSQGRDTQVRDNQGRESRNRDDQPRDRPMRDASARDASDQPRRPRRERPERNDSLPDNAPVGIDVTVLPPAIGIEPMREEIEPADAAAPKRRGRPRKVAAESADNEGAAA